LSYMTSPTTGCGPAVACVPKQANTSVAATPTTTESSCYAGAKEPITTILSDSTWNISYPFPTSQYGVWNGTPPTGYDSTTGLYTGFPTLISGPQKLRQSAALVYTEIAPQLSALYGNAAQYGKSASAALTAPFDAAALSALGPWTACKGTSFTNP
jgi:hypothetical protein